MADFLEEAKRIGAIARAVPSLAAPFLRHLAPVMKLTSPPDDPGLFHQLWLDIERARGRKDLELAFKALLSRNTDFVPRHLLLALGTNHTGWYEANGHGVVNDKTRARFFLRYLEHRDWEELSTTRQAKMLAQMLIDEFELPGQRLNTARENWTALTQKAELIRGSCTSEELGDMHMSELISGEFYDAIRAFVDGIWLKHLVEVVETTHADEAAIFFRNMVIPDNGSESGRQILEWRKSKDSDDLTFQVGLILLGFKPLRPADASTQLVRGVCPEWQEHVEEDWSSADEGDFAVEEFVQARATIRAALNLDNDHPVRWRRVFQRLQRYTANHGPEETLQFCWKGMSDSLRLDFEEELEQTVSRGRLWGEGWTREDNVAAVLADEFVADARSDDGKPTWWWINALEADRKVASRARDNTLGVINGMEKRTDQLMEQNLALEQEVKELKAAHASEVEEMNGKYARDFAMMEDNHAEELQQLRQATVGPPAPPPKSVKRGKRKRSADDDDTAQPRKTKRVATRVVIPIAPPVPASAPATTGLRRSARIRDRMAK